MTVSLPTAANFSAYGQKANVVGGQRVSLTSVGFYDDTRTSAVAPASAEVVPGRFVMYDTAGNFDGSLLTREPRKGIKAVVGAFVAADFAGIALRRPGSTPIRGAIPSAQTVNDTQTESFVAGDVLSRAVQNEWWVEFDSATAPAAGAAVFVDDVTAGFLGRASASVGQALATTVAVFTGRVEQGLNGLYYASVNILNKLA